MASHRRRVVVQIFGAASAVCAGLLVLANTPTVSRDHKVTNSTVLPLPTQGEAESLLSQATSFARSRNYAGLCDAVAQDGAMCRKILEWADISHAEPSAVLPSVEGASSHPDTGNMQGAEILHIRGTRADGSSYRSDFSAVRTLEGQIRSQNAVYWFSSIEMSSH